MKLSDDQKIYFVMVDDHTEATLNEKLNELYNNSFVIFYSSDKIIGLIRISTIDTPGPAANTPTLQ